MIYHERVGQQEELPSRYSGPLIGAPLRNVGLWWGCGDKAHHFNSEHHCHPWSRPLLLYRCQIVTQGTAVRGDWQKLMSFRSVRSCPRCIACIATYMPHKLDVFFSGSLSSVSWSSRGRGTSVNKWPQSQSQRLAQATSSVCVT